mmetsp:Transcript_13682/g.40672  ORF Transcript_13682/g.40672 Transcript_13682/m.40672 type:complete len:289 (+) Transcript_13682:1151-2017(+)
MERGARDPNLRAGQPVAVPGVRLRPGVGRRPPGAGDAAVQELRQGRRLRRRLAALRGGHGLRQRHGRVPPRPRRGPAAAPAGRAAGVRAGQPPAGQGAERAGPARRGLGAPRAGLVRPVLPLRSRGQARPELQDEAHQQDLVAGLEPRARGPDVRPGRRPALQGLRLRPGLVRGPARAGDAAGPRLRPRGRLRGGAAADGVWQRREGLLEGPRGRPAPGVGGGAPRVRARLQAQRHDLERQGFARGGLGRQVRPLLLLRGPGEARDQVPDQAQGQDAGAGVERGPRGR